METNPTLNPAKLEKEVERLKAQLKEITHSKQLLLLLSNATEVLVSDVLDYSVRLKHLTEVIVPHFADWCAIDIVASPNPSYTIVTHSDPEKLWVAEELQKKYIPRLESRYGVAEVIRTGEPTLYKEMPDDLVRATTQNEEHYQLMKKLGIVSVMVVPLKSNTQIIGAITFVASESGHRYSETDLDIALQLATRAAVALDNAMLHEEVLEASRAKEKFLAMLAHELRNPLTPIRNSLPILHAKGEDDYELQDIANIMDRQVTTMGRLLDDLFDVSRITEGKIQFHMENVDLISTLEHAVGTMRPEFDKKGFKFSVYLSEGPLIIHADRVRIEQVIVNLLNNAAKYTPSGGHITLECSHENEEAIIRIRDDGKGIPPNMLKKIFQLFIQVEQSIDRPEGGLGLGLTLVQMLVEKHNGTVSAISEGVGKGSEFTVRLPIVQAPATPRETDRPKKVFDDPKKRILIVDDNEDAANSIGKLLRRIGHEIRITYDAPSALDISKEFDPEVILLDIGLPGMDGYEAAAKFRDLYGKKHPNLLIIALSGYGQDEDRRKTKEAGFNFHLVKPFDTQELRDIINRWEPTKK